MSFIVKNQAKKIKMPTLYSIIAASDVQPSQSVMIPICVNTSHSIYIIHFIFFFVKNRMAKEESPFEAIFGSHPYTKIVNTLVTHPNCEYTLNEIAEIVEARPFWALDVKDALLRYRIIQRGSKEDTYKFDSKSPVGSLLNTLSFKLAGIDIDLEMIRGMEKDGPKN